MHAFGEFSVVLNFFESFSENSSPKKDKSKLRHHHVISIFPSCKQLLLNKLPVKASVCLYFSRLISASRENA